MMSHFFTDQAKAAKKKTKSLNKDKNNAEFNKPTLQMITRKKTSWTLLFGLEQLYDESQT